LKGNYVYTMSVGEAAKLIRGVMNENASKALVDGLGKFIDLEADFQTKADRKVVKIMVELDLQERYQRKWRLYEVSECLPNL
jgi:hypothetical protein